MNVMADVEIAERLERGEAGIDLLNAAACRLYALSAHVALLKASLAQVEREAPARPLKILADIGAEVALNSMPSAEPVCQTCGGAGMIGGHRGQTPEQYEEWGEPCPDCSAIEGGIPTSEPVAWAAWIDGSNPAKDRPQLSIEEPRAYSLRRPLCFADQPAASAEPVATVGRHLACWWGFDLNFTEAERPPYGAKLYTAPQPDRVSELEAELESIKRDCTMWFGRHEDKTDELIKARAEVERLRTLLSGLVEDVQGLMCESDGVAGLHSNGDVAPWSELEAGGQFERLTHLPAAAEEASRASTTTDRTAELEAEVERLRKDAERLNAIAAETWKLDPFDAGDDDVGWRVVQYHMGRPSERTVAEVFIDDPRVAIDSAIAVKEAQS